MTIAGTLEPDVEEPVGFVAVEEAFAGGTGSRGGIAVVPLAASGRLT